MLTAILYLLLLVERYVKDYLLSCCATVIRNLRRKQNGLNFRLIELKIEEMEEDIENLDSVVEEHDGILGKGYLFSGNIIFFG